MSKSVLKNSIYSIVDLMVGNKGVSRKVNGFEIKFPARWSRYYTNAYEEDNYNFLKEHVKPGMHVIDIGAHIGLFSVVTSGLVGMEGKVVSFEPTPSTFEVFEEVLRVNLCGNVKSVRAAVGKEKGKTTFYISDAVGANSNSLVVTGVAKVKGYEVVVTRIDDVVTDYDLMPGLIKIDAEGAEYDVLRGGEETFKHKRPLIILGLHPKFILEKGDSLSDIWHLLASWNYKVMSDNREMTEVEFCSHEHLFDVQCLPF